MMPMTITLGADHAGFSHKEAVKKHLVEKGFLVLDKGTHSDESVDYPDFIHPVAKAIETGDAALGIVFCGSGNGVAMTANKHQHIRAALTWNEELATLARQHNDANVLSIPSRYVSEDAAIAMADAFLSSSFEGGRHKRRVDKIACI
jgi:ribose 5-phosphate isomerase B